METISINEEEDEDVRVLVKEYAPDSLELVCILYPCFFVFFLYYLTLFGLGTATLIFLTKDESNSLFSLKFSNM